MLTPWETNITACWFSEPLIRQVLYLSPQGWQLFCTVLCTQLLQSADLVLPLRMEMKAAHQPYPLQHWSVRHVQMCSTEAGYSLACSRSWDSSSVFHAMQVKVFPMCSVAQGRSSQSAPASGEIGVALKGLAIQWLEPDFWCFLLQLQGCKRAGAPPSWSCLLQPISTTRSEFRQKCTTSSRL